MRNLPTPDRFGLTCLFGAMLLFTTLPGCSSGSRNPVEGKVLFKNQPAVGAVVVFHLQGDESGQADRPAGVTDENGVFRLSTAAGEGAPAGSYVVTVFWPEDALPVAKKKAFTTDRVERTDRLGGRYSDPKTSPLRAEVISGANNLDPIPL